MAGGGYGSGGAGDPLAELPADWSWPAWCMEAKNPEIEVFVIDEDMEAKGAWVPAVPKMRVVDASGKDAYINAEYLWEHESYVEDFEPQRVRRRGDFNSLADMFKRGGNAGLPSSDLADTRGNAGSSSAVVLECVFAEGVDLANVPPTQRVIVIPMNAGTVAGEVNCLASGAKVGRLHQPAFFERFVPVMERLAIISRSHFELRQEGDGSLSMRKLSRNALLLNGVAVEEGMPMRLEDRTQLGFRGVSEQQQCFLLLRVTRSQSVHPSAADISGEEGRAGRVPTMVQNIAGVLECVRCAGRPDLNAPGMPPPDARVVPLPLGMPLEIGRQSHQLFEGLLQAEPQWITSISRKHLRVTLSRGNSSLANTLSAHLTDASPSQSAVSLHVENLSTNVIVVGGAPLGKGGTTTLSEGSTISFVSTPDGGNEAVFFEFMLRRARAVT